MQSHIVVDVFFQLAKLISISTEQHPILCPLHLATTPPLSVSMNLTTLSTLYKWDYMVLVFCDQLISLGIRDFPGGSDGKIICLQCGRPGFDPWVGKIPLEKEMAAHSSIVAWKIPWTEEPGRLQSMGSQRVGHDRATSLSLSVSSGFIHVGVCVRIFFLFEAE